MFRAASRRMASARSSVAVVRSGSSRTKLGVLFLAIGLIFVLRRSYAAKTELSRRGLRRSARDAAWSMHCKLTWSL